MKIKSGKLYHRDPIEKHLDSLRHQMKPKIESLKYLEIKNTNADQIFDNFAYKMGKFPEINVSKASINEKKDEPREYPGTPEGHLAFVQTIPGHGTNAYFFSMRPEQDLGEKPVGSTTGKEILSVTVELTPQDLADPTTAQEQAKEFFKSNLANIERHHNALREELATKMLALKAEIVPIIEAKRKFLITAHDIGSFLKE